jgi:Uri superfamily endonuclease
VVRPFDPPRASGAYVLLIALSRPLELPIARLSRPTLSSSKYVYCGSARGPGGLAARIGRHLRPDKPPHWHIDHLTANGQVLDVLWRTGASECELHRRISGGAGVSTPVPGFGSSDCRTCPSHLLKVPAEFRLSPEFDAVRHILDGV